MQDTRGLPGDDEAPGPADASDVDLADLDLAELFRTDNPVLNGLLARVVAQMEKPGESYAAHGSTP